MVLELYPFGHTDKKGNFDDIVWDVAQLMNILKSKKDIFVATIGRYGNRRKMRRST